MAYEPWPLEIEACRLPYENVKLKGIAIDFELDIGRFYVRYGARHVIEPVDDHDLPWRLTSNQVINLPYMALMYGS